MAFDIDNVTLYLFRHPKRMMKGLQYHYLANEMPKQVRHDVSLLDTVDLYRFDVL